MNLVQFIYGQISLVALGSAGFTLVLYYWWRRDRLFLAFAAYALGVSTTLAINFWLQYEPRVSLLVFPLQMALFLAVVVAFYEVNRLMLGGSRAWPEYAAFVTFLVSLVAVLVVALFAPERLEIFFIPDRIGQVFFYARIRGIGPERLSNLIPIVTMILGWMVWSMRHFQFLYAARRRVEVWIAAPVVFASVAAPVHDFGVIAGWWGGVFLAFFIFGLVGTAASFWLVYQLFLHSQALEDLTENLERKVGERTTELKATNLELAEANALKNDFLAICSHDLKNLLVSVQGYGELLELTAGEGASPEKVKEYAKEIQKSSRRMLDLIKDLLDSARLESGRAVLEVAPAWVGDVVSEAFAQYRREADEKGVRYSLEMSSDLPEIPLDRSKMQQAVANLLHNSLKFTPAGGQVTCTASRWHGGCEIQVRDTGMGIDPADQSIVFDKFAIARKRRSDRSTKLGTGLGLSITKTFVELHGGAISLESEPGVGTRFRIQLPGDGPDRTPGEPT